MRNQRLTIAQDVQDRLVRAERLNDEAIVASAELMIALLNGGSAINAAPVVGQDAYEEIVSALSASSETRRRLIAAHERLAEVKQKVGLGIVALGGGANKKVTDFNTTGNLSVVESSQAA